MWRYILGLVIGYFCGCVITGYFVGKLYHVDIRKQGSGNAGSTNVLRSLGKGPALMTFAGDLAKVIIPIILLRFLFGHAVNGYLLSLYTGLGCTLGHNYPFYLGFKGGKGIAVTAGAIIASAYPLVVPIGLAVFILAVVLTRYVSVGSLLVAWILPINTLLFHRQSPIFVHMMIISLLFTGLAYFQHRSNIVRLIHGTENPFYGKGKEKQCGKEEHYE
jgi:glycerol-3-phosphate acyltransferase PlsY